MGIPNDSLGNYKIMTPDFVRSLETTIDIAAGRFVNLTTGTKFGRNPSVSTTNDPADVWEGGGDYTGQPLSYTPETVEIFSDTGVDTALEGGAQTVRIIGLKSEASTAYESEDLVMNGTTPVTSTSSWWRINRCYVLTAGANGENVGTLIVRASTTTANIFVSMIPGFNQTLIGALTVPANKSLIIKSIHVSMARANGAAGSALVTLRVRPPGGVYRTFRAFDISNSAPVNMASYAGTCLDAGSDWKFRVENVSDNGTSVEAILEFLEIGN